MVIFNNIKFDGFKVNMTFVCSLRIDFNARRNLIWINRIHRDAATFLTYKSFRATSRQGQCDPSPLFKHRKTSETLCCRKIKRNFHCTVCHWLTYNWYLLKKKKIQQHPVHALRSTETNAMWLDSKFREVPSVLFHSPMHHADIRSPTKVQLKSPFCLT